MDKERAKGMLWGLVVGDCIGSPIQFSGKDTHPWITEVVECPVFHLPPGYWTDDSSLAMCIMESYHHRWGYDLQNIADTFLDWYEKGFCSSIDHAFDVGMATAQAMEGIRRGKLRNGTEEGQGNGSIMRFAPSYLLAQKEKDSQRVMHEISDLTHYSSVVRRVVDRFAGILDDHFKGQKTGEKSAYSTRAEVNNSGWAVSTLDAALWAFQTTGTFEDGMVAAVNLGGDSDTIGAVYGQLAGAYYGFKEIPSRWVQAVKDWKRMDRLIDRFLTEVE